MTQPYPAALLPAHKPIQSHSVQDNGLDAVRHFCCIYCALPLPYCELLLLLFTVPALPPAVSDAQPRTLVQLM